MILDTLKQELIESQKSHEAAKLELLRYLLAAIKNKEIELRPMGKELNDEEILKVIKKQIKQRNDSIENFRLGKRDDLVQKENVELGILEDYYKKFAPAPLN